MSIKTAIFIALTGLSLNSFLWIAQLTRAFEFSGQEEHIISNILSRLLGNGSLILFPAVLLLKQKSW
jgi:hypothetical protein